ncbi:peptidoglycan binding protein CsiV [Reinekea forsetii]|nr:peptidoglycan binding protein CsiV [Reinekea forsetii]
MMRNNLTLTTLLSLSLWSATVHAEDLAEERWFQVEIIAFTNADVETDSPEAWPSYSTIETPEQFIQIKGVTELLTANSAQEPTEEELAELEEATLEPQMTEINLEAFVALSEFERQLNVQRLSLEGSRSHRVLFHEAWNQPVPNRDNVIPIRIDGGEKYGRQAELQGYIDLYVERYLHLNTRLTFLEYAKSQDPFSFFSESNTSGSATDAVDDFGGLSLINADSLLNNRVSRKSDDYFISTSAAAMNENRRMRSKELHYFDNPKFGLIVLITPIELKQPDEN